MSLRKNILANYISQIYVTIIGIVIVPVYIKYMGAEAYGLVGFFAMLQAWFMLLDMGLTPTMARETARFHGGATDARSYRRLVRVLEGIFVIVALLGGGIMFMSSTYIAQDWLKAIYLPIDEVQLSIELIAIIIALRWMGGLYRGVISGSEQLIWLGGYSAFIASLRFVGVLAVLQYIGTTPTLFFGYQLGVAVLDLIILLLKANCLLPVIPIGGRIAWSWKPLKLVLKFSLSIAFTSSVWVLVTQTDKLVLSKILPLAEYGYFTLAVLVASGVMVISSPISSAIMPRMSKLEADGNHDGLIRVYRQATQLVAIIASASSITIAFYAEPLLWAWTGDKQLALNAAPILCLYALGNGILAVAAFPYYLQYAKGDLRLHLIGNALFALLLIPAIIWAASHYGSVGAGYAWVATNIIYFITWVPLVHDRFEKCLNMKWFSLDVLAVYLSTSLVSYGLFMIMPIINHRGWQFSYIVIVGLLVSVAGVLASSMFWTKVNLLFKSSTNKK